MGSLRYPWSRPSRIIPIGGDLTWLGFSGPRCLAEVQVTFRLKALDETASSMGGKLSGTYVFPEDEGQDGC